MDGKRLAPQEDTVDPIPGLPAAASPRALPSINRDHWGIEIMQRTKDVILGEVGITNGSDNALRNVFSLTSFARKISEPVSPSPIRAIKQFQDNKTALPPRFSSFR
ncbi:MAG: hypothetical protein ACR2KT_10275 [Methylocella sp.]